MKAFWGILLAACLAHIVPAFAQTTKTAVAPPAVQKEFDGFITKFRAALKANDAAAVASMTRFPIEAEESIRDAAQFRTKAYPKIFTAKNRTCIEHGMALYDRDGENNDGYSIFCGEIIFSFTRTPTGFLFTDIGAND